MALIRETAFDRDTDFPFSQSLQSSPIPVMETNTHRSRKPCKKYLIPPLYELVFRPVLLLPPTQLAILFIRYNALSIPICLPLYPFCSTHSFLYISETQYLLLRNDQFVFVVCLFVYLAEYLARSAACVGVEPVT